ncbi:MAG: nucleotidyltransferase domain-containing protein [Pseudomonadota bacterium]
MQEKHDVIEYDIIDEIDIYGWDVRKALRLFWKSNPTFVGWLQSSVVYVNDNYFVPQARNLLDSIYSVEKGIYYLKSALIPIKKYQNYCIETK